MAIPITLNPCAVSTLLFNPPLLLFELSLKMSGTLLALPHPLFALELGHGPLDLTAKERLALDEVVRNFLGWCPRRSKVVPDSLRLGNHDEIFQIFKAFDLLVERWAHSLYQELIVTLDTLFPYRKLCSQSRHFLCDPRGAIVAFAIPVLPEQDSGNLGM